MSGSDDIVTKKLEDGSYFKDAREWYIEKYLYPIKERSYYLVTCLLVCYAFFHIVIFTKNLQGDESETPFAVYAEDATKYFSKIAPLIEDSDTPQSAVAKYLITDYLKSREEYFHLKMKGPDLKLLLKKIKISSAKSVFIGYQNYMSKTNPYSPFIRYRDHTNRFIQIKDFTFASPDLTNGKAEILFEAIEKSSYETHKTLWKAFISFRLPNVEVISKSGVPLRFVITHYKVKLAQ